MDLKTAIGYVRAYRRNGRTCYVHAANRGVKIFETSVGKVEFRAHAQHCINGRSKSKFCAYLIWHVEGGTGKSVLSRDFPRLLAA